jgi:hypothetical protein
MLLVLAALLAAPAFAMSDAEFAQSVESIRTRTSVMIVNQREAEQRRRDAETSRRSAEAYVLLGNAWSNPGGPSTQGLKNKPFVVGVKERVAGPFSLGFEHINDGHFSEPVGNTTTNHRDGYAVLVWLDAPVGSRAKFEAGVGPFFAMNTTSNLHGDGREVDEKQLGVVGAGAFVLNLGGGTGLRVQAEYAKMPRFDTKTLLIGVNQVFDGADAPSSDGGDASIGIFGGSAITNRGGHVGRAAAIVEYQKTIDEAMRYSVDVIAEGADNGAQTHRTGVAAQAWYVSPSAGRCRLAVGAGPYVAAETAQADKGAKLLAVVSVSGECELGKGWKVVPRFTRVVSGYNKDADLFLIGFVKELH